MKCLPTRALSQITDVLMCHFSKKLGEDFKVTNWVECEKRSFNSIHYIKGHSQVSSVTVAHNAVMLTLSVTKWSKIIVCIFTDYLGHFLNPSIYSVPAIAFAKLHPALLSLTCITSWDTRQIIDRQDRPTLRAGKRHLNRKLIREGKCTGCKGTKATLLGILYLATKFLH